MNLILFQSHWKNDAIDHFNEVIGELELRYFAGDFLGFAFDSPGSLDHAVSRAVRTISASGMALRSHLKPVFLEKEGMIVCDWKISSLARKLILLNADPANPVIAKMQMEILKDRA